MRISQLIFRNFRKNLKNYYLYVFALTFSVALYFSFVTLQYDPALNGAENSIKGAAAIKVASILLVAIVATFLLYANNLFIKRRSKEIGLFQLIGMTKNKIFRILTAENFMLYFGSLIVGIFIGFSFSKLMTMMMFTITGIEEVAKLRFSIEALSQTLIVFAIIYALIMIMNYIFIKRQRIISLFQMNATPDEHRRTISILEVILGMMGIVLIIAGYYVSSILFNGKFPSTESLMLAMLFILGSVIVGTYLFYKGSIRFIFSIIRNRKKGYVNVRDVLSLTSIMFRMKSNALLLTVITTISALSISLLSLSYISYYSAEKTAASYVPNDFALANEENVTTFKEALESAHISFEETVIDVVVANVNISNIIESKTSGEFPDNFKESSYPIISDEAIQHTDVSPNEAYFAGFSDVMDNFMTWKDSGSITLLGSSTSTELQYLGLKKEHILSLNYTLQMPVIIVDQTVFHDVKQDAEDDIQPESPTYYGIDIVERSQLEAANDIYIAQDYQGVGNVSLELLSSSLKQQNGLTMFIVGFLGLTFLITSGCILYFKQMDESESEKANYTILRKLGFTQSDLLQGIRRKQLFNFGIPLVIGLLHSYFAVRSGWFLFGTSLWTPMIIVMVIYTALYSLFAIQSVLYYRRVIKQAL
ncbi:FtsX-like permease family protein [Pontibacillus litoralis]|uniref:Bacitracin ABC transporter permease n=1 Tax=Pontibacillus litoralis JSM 072002 TaxID=1385512 RepID=A0A0A5G4U3_9BACI|nr:ABC transporter permease [Pontibacillus litoralis]KGX86095.1 bacitracin ABC transporter permease [Pontibacillus litoralis JSM 072002]